MRSAWPVDQIRAAEQAALASLPAGALMDRAAAALAATCVGELSQMVGRVYGSRVVVLSGSGDNGGDALLAAARLADRGVVVTVVPTSARQHVRAAATLRAAGARFVKFGDLSTARAALDRADLVLDGIVGIGGKGALRAELTPLLAALGSARMLAVDLPSGVDADTGYADRKHSIHADVTVTFGVLKPGLLVGVGAELAGEVRLAPIGIESYLPAPHIHVLESSDVAGLLPRPGEHDDKYTRGVVGIAAGSHLYGGAAVLATGSAIRGGAGMVRYVGPARRAVTAAWPEVVSPPDGTSPVDAGRVQSWVFGPGSGTDDAAFATLADLLRTTVPVLVDADGITLLAKSPALVRGRRDTTVLTPHDREFARLAGDVGADRIGAARRAARDLGATMLLKGNRTIVAAPDGTVYVNPTGTPWLGTAGSGDVLSGLIGSLLAAGLAGPQAAAVGAYVHGVAGQLAATDGPPAAPDVLQALRPAIRSLQES